MAALPLHVGGGNEGRADQQKHRRLVLPIVGAVKQGSAEHAVAEDDAGGDQRQRSKNNDDAVANVKPPFARRQNHVAAGGGLRREVLILERKVDHAATSEATFNRLAAIAVFPLLSFQAVSRAMSRHLPTVATSSALILQPAF